MTKKLRTLFGANLKATRRSRDITQAELAEKIDKSVNLVSQIERGTNAPSFDTIVLICNELNIAPELLFKGWSMVDKGESGKFLSIQRKLSKLSIGELNWIEGILESVLEKRK